MTSISFGLFSVIVPHIRLHPPLIHVIVYWVNFIHLHPIVENRWLSCRNLAESDRKLVIFQVLAESSLSCKILPESRLSGRICQNSGLSDRRKRNRLMPKNVQKYWITSKPNLKMCFSLLKSFFSRKHLK